MIRRRMIQAAMVALVLAASAPVAHAGGGGAGSPVSAAIYNCYVISGTANVPQVLTMMDDQFGELTGVKLGKAKLLCTPATGTVEDGELMPGDFSTADHIKCYNASPKGANPKVTEVVADPFVTEAVKVGAPQFVCVQAFKCPVGASCPPEE